MRAHGPLFLDVFGVDEDDVLQTWTVERFHRYKAYAVTRLERGSGGG